MPKNDVRAKIAERFRNAKPQQKNTLPALDIGTGVNHSPHIVILGAGASRACCPKGDRNGRQIPLMADIIDCVGLTDLIRNCGQPIDGNFETVYSAIYRAGDKAALNEIDQKTRTYFSALELPDHVTVYDYLVLSLRQKDMIITFNWDPLLVQSFKRWRHLGAVLPELIFLHGNVDIGVDLESMVSGILSDTTYPDRKLCPTPLLYPVDQKDYKKDPFVADQWRRATDRIGDAYYMTIFGYSAPTTDVEAVSLLHEAWKTNSTHRLAQISMIDIRDEAEVIASWSDFIVANHHSGVLPSFDGSILMRHPRRSCEAFAFATLQQAPWHEDPFPINCTCNELEAWLEPLISEEATGKLAGNPHH